jgi:hypothetical protein
MKFPDASGVAADVMSPTMEDWGGWGARFQRRATSLTFGTAGGVPLRHSSSALVRPIRTSTIQ